MQIVAAFFVGIVAGIGISAWSRHQLNRLLLDMRGDRRAHVPEPDTIEARNARGLARYTEQAALQRRDT